MLSAADLSNLVRASKDHYACLGLQRAADGPSIKRAYHQRAKILHPDKNTLTDATSVFQRVQEAFAILKDTNKRAAYDAATTPRASAQRRHVNKDPFSWVDALTKSQLVEELKSRGHRPPAATLKGALQQELRRLLTLTAVMCSKCSTKFNVMMNGAAVADVHCPGCQALIRVAGSGNSGAQAAAAAAAASVAAAQREANMKAWMKTKERNEQRAAEQEQQRQEQRQRQQQQEQETQQRQDQRQQRAAAEQETQRLRQQREERHRQQQQQHPQSDAQRRLQKQQQAEEREAKVMAKRRAEEHERLTERHRLYEDTQTQANSELWAALQRRLAAEKEKPQTSSAGGDAQAADTGGLRTPLVDLKQTCPVSGSCVSPIDLTKRTAAHERKRPRQPEKADAANEPPAGKTLFGWLGVTRRSSSVMDDDGLAPKPKKKRVKRPKVVPGQSRLDAFLTK